MLSYVLLTRNRPEQLRRTLAALAMLDPQAHDRMGGAEVIVVDNASETLPVIEAGIRSRLSIRLIPMNENRWAAARNVGVEQARGDWIVMLDDDSHPLDASHVQVLEKADASVAAIGADIRLPDGPRESGGLPEVIIGCGAAIRRHAFLAVGGYDPAFQYYAEEYDLCAKLLLAGWRIEHDLRFRVRHHKAAAGRDFSAIVHRLVRNNCWIMQRYAPGDVRARAISDTIARYAHIAVHEKAAEGFARGMSDLVTTLATQPRMPMSEGLWDRFTGAAAVRAAITSLSAQSIAVVDEGKNWSVIVRELERAGRTVTDDAREADVAMIGTLSPGPMLDAYERRTRRGEHAVTAWWPRGVSETNSGSRTRTLQQCRYDQAAPQTAGRD